MRLQSPVPDATSMPSDDLVTQENTPTQTEDAIDLTSSFSTDTLGN